MTVCQVQTILTIVCEVGKKVELFLTLTLKSE